MGDVTSKAEGTAQQPFYSAPLPSNTKWLSAGPGTFKESSRRSVRLFSCGQQPGPSLPACESPSLPGGQHWTKVLLQSSLEIGTFGLNEKHSKQSENSWLEMLAAQGTLPSFAFTLTKLKPHSSCWTQETKSGRRALGKSVLKDRT